MVLPSTGTLSFSQIKTEFGATYVKYSLFLGLSAGIPITGPLSLSQLRGKSASTPSVSAISNQNVNTASSIQYGSINLGSYVSDTYGGTLSYSSPSFNSSYVSSASMSGSTLSYSVPINKWANTTPITVVVTNKFGKTATISIPLFITGYNISTTTPSSSSLTNNTATYSLSSYFTDYSGSGLSYSITSNPYSNASISSGTLSIVGNYRNTSYSVIVNASNSFGQSANVSFSIVESNPTPYNTLSLDYYGNALVVDWYNYSATQLYVGRQIKTSTYFTMPSSRNNCQLTLTVNNIGAGTGYVQFGICDAYGTNYILCNPPAKSSGVTQFNYTSQVYTGALTAGGNYWAFITLNPQSSVPWQAGSVNLYVSFW